MKRMIITAILAAGVLSLLAACSTTDTSTVAPPAIDQAKARQVLQTSVKAARIAYGLAVTAATAYSALPPCTSAAGAATGICSQPGVVAQIAAAEKIAGPALAAADKTVNDPAATADSASMAMATLGDAMTVFTQVTSNLPELSGEPRAAVSP